MKAYYKQPQPVFGPDEAYEVFLDRAVDWKIWQHRQEGETREEHHHRIFDESLCDPKWFKNSLKQKIKQDQLEYERILKREVDRIAVIAEALCKSRKFETGEGTCSLICLDQLGNARRNCHHRERVHRDLARKIHEALLKAEE